MCNLKIWLNLPWGVGTRTTNTQAGDYLITGTDWKGQVPSRMKQIPSPDNSILVIGRVLVYSDSDVSTAYNLTKQIQICTTHHTETQPVMLPMSRVCAAGAPCLASETWVFARTNMNWRGNGSLGATLNQQK